MSVLGHVSSSWTGCLHSFRPCGQNMPSHLFQPHLRANLQSTIGVYGECKSKVCSLSNKECTRTDTVFFPLFTFLPPQGQDMVVGKPGKKQMNGRANYCILTDICLQVLGVGSAGMPPLFSKSRKRYCNQPGRLLVGIAYNFLTTCLRRKRREGEVRGLEVGWGDL